MNLESFLENLGNNGHLLHDCWPVLFNYRITHLVNIMLDYNFDYNPGKTYDSDTFFMIYNQGELGCKIKNKVTADRITKFSTLNKHSEFNQQKQINDFNISLILHTPANTSNSKNELDGYGQVTFFNAINDISNMVMENKIPLCFPSSYDGENPYSIVYFMN